jgi:hypothetical protein
MGIITDILYKIYHHYCDLLYNVEIKINNKKYRIDYKMINAINIEIREEKFKIIDQILKSQKIKTSNQKHLFNVLYAQNKFIHLKACFLKYFKNIKIPIQELSSAYFQNDDLCLIQDDNLTILKIKSKYKLLLVFEIIIETISRIIKFKEEKSNYPTGFFNYKENENYTKILRAWVEVSENIFVQKLEKSFKNTIIHLNPFNILKERQIFYRKNLEDTKKSYFYYIPNFLNLNVLKKMTTIIFSKQAGYLKSGFIEYVFQQRESIDLVNFYKENFPNLSEIYTKEEFNPAFPYVADLVKRNGVILTNSAHGLGTYCPYIDASEFYFFSKMQKRYYIGNFKSKYFGLHFNKSKLLDIQQDKELSLFFVGQSILSSIESRNFKFGYKKIIGMLERLHEELNIKIFAKYHPNSKQEDRIFSNKIKIINSIDELPENNNYIAITLFSTYVLDIISKMPFIILNPLEHDLFKYQFPQSEQINIPNYEILKKRIQLYRAFPNEYLSFLENFVSEIETNFIIKFH